jgi:hypothetical protein
MVNVLVSEDNGKTYSKNLKSISLNTDIYVKCEIIIKSAGLWGSFSENTVNFDINLSHGIKLCDYSYGNYENLDGGGNQPNCKKKISLCFIEKKEPSEQQTKSRASFTVIASNKPRKSEIIFKIEKQFEETSFDIEFTCREKIHKTYNKKTTLELIRSGV